MDLRLYRPGKRQIEQAHDLTIRGLLTYQPWIIADDLETGVGYEFDQGRYIGLVHNPRVDGEALKVSHQLDRIILDRKRVDAFRRSNQRLREFYERIVDMLWEAGGENPSSSFLDVGCNSGYLPIGLSLRGADRALGCDRQDFSETIALINDITGADAVFVPATYDSQTRDIAGVQPADIVSSMIVLCHLSDPLVHLAKLGELARKALLVWTMVNEDEKYSIHYGEPRGDYPQDHFPYCFDNHVCPSVALLRKSLELMGFGDIRPIVPSDMGFPNWSWNGYPYRGFLAIRS